MPVLKPAPSPQNVLDRKVCVVIAGRNYGMFLQEAISSAVNQTCPCEVIYADDCSIDNSIEIALKFVERGVRVSPSGVHLGVCQSRNRGFSLTSAPYVIFMDADDVLPSDYVKLMLEDIESLPPETPFVYPNAQAFGDMDHLWSNRPWNSQYDIWERNQVSTTAIWRSSVVRSIGGWCEDVPSMWDYDFALRCSRYGTPAAGRATLRYRIHENSVSHQLNERMTEEYIHYAEVVRRRNVSLGIGCLLGGRLPNLFPAWLDKIACAIRYMNYGRLRKIKPPLFFLLHNKAQAYVNSIMAYAAKYADTFSSVSCRFVTKSISTDNELQRRFDVSSLLASSCQTIQDTLKTDLVWLIEDDVMVPLRSAEYLFAACTRGAKPPIGVSGTYFNRHVKGQLLGGWIKNGKHFEPNTYPMASIEVDFVGTGCLMYWPYRPGSPKAWRPICSIENCTAHDWAWSEDVEGKILLLGTVDCKHAITEKEFT